MAKAVEAWELSGHRPGRRLPSTPRDPAHCQLRATPDHPALETTDISPRVSGRPGPLHWVQCEPWGESPGCDQQPSGHPCSDVLCGFGTDVLPGADQTLASSALLGSGLPRLLVPSLLVLAWATECPLEAACPGGAGWTRKIQNSTSLSLLLYRQVGEAQRGP